MKYQLTPHGLRIADTDGQYNLVVLIEYVAELIAFLNEHAEKIAAFAEAKVREKKWQKQTELRNKIESLNNQIDKAKAELAEVSK